MSEERIRWGGSLRPVRLAIVAVLALIALVSACMRIIAQSAKPSPLSYEADRAQLSIATRIIAKFIAVIEPTLPNLGRKEYANVMRELDELLRTISRSGDMNVLREIGILYGYLGMRERASECMSEFIRLKEAGGGIADEEVKLWRRMLSETPIALNEVKTLERKIERLHLGWLEEMAKAWLYEKAFMFVKSEQAKASMRSSAIRSLLPLFSLLMVVIALCLAGIILSPILFILLPKWLQSQRESASHIAASPYALFEAFAIYLFLMEVVTPMVVRALAAHASIRDIAMSLIVMMVVNGAISALSILWLAVLLRASSSSLSAVGLKCDAIAKDFLHGFMAYVSMLPWVWLTSALSMLISKWLFGRLSEPAHPVAQVMMFTSSRALIITVFLIGVLIAPTIEELIFRGALYGALRWRMGILPSAILSSLLFALLHPQSIVGVPPLFIIGVSLSLLYEVRRSIIGCIFAHALINFVSLLTLTLLASL